MPKPLKMLTIVGARPQFIKAATVSRVLRQPRFSGRIEEVLVHTGQHYDDAMSASFFRDLAIPEPGFNLAVGSGTHGAQTGAIMERLEPVVASAGADVMLVFGDTNSTLAAALVAAKTPLRLAHVEAGLRSWRRGMPEEINRVVTDRLSDLLFCPGEQARQNLAREGRTEGVHVVGDIMYDGFVHELARADASAVLARHGLAARTFALATLHRAESTDDRDRLAWVLDGLARLARRMPVVLPLHPRTRSAIARLDLAPPEGVRLVEPLPYPEMVALTASAAVVATDSGGLQKEAYFASTPCVTLRDETEWVETLGSGWNRLSAPGRGDLDGDVAAALAVDRSVPPQPLYGDGRAGERIVEALLAS